MNNRVGLKLLPLLALSFSSAASATTVITGGSYGDGESVYVSDSFGLGPGTYRFTLSLSGAAELVSGEVTKLTNYVDYCDLEGDGVLSYCSSNDVPSSPFLEPAGPNLYQAMLAVKAPYSVYYSDGSRTDYSDDCCTFNFEILGSGAGTYVFSYGNVPEASTWALMILGMGMVGGALRMRRPDLSNASRMAT